MDDMDEQSARQPQDRPRKALQSFPQRSTASNNWRVKDDAPRTEQQPRSQGRTKGGFDQNRSAQDGSGDGSSGTRLYVGNLLYSAQKNDIENFFTGNGFKVTNISMSIDPMTGRNPSYCFVDFETVDEANRAMSELNGQDVLGRPVRINVGVAKKPGDGSGFRTNSYNRGWQRQDSGNGQDSPRSGSERWNRGEGQPNLSSSQTQSKRLYVGNLPQMEPQSAVEAAMQQLFSGFEIASVSKLISPHESKKAEPGDHHYLFVDMASADDIDAAIETLDGAQTPWGGNVKVSKARDNRDRRANNRDHSGYQRRQGDDGREQGEWRRSEPAS